MFESWSDCCFVRNTQPDVMQNIEEYDVRIVDQLLNFMHSYTSEVLQDAQVGKMHVS